MTQHWVNRFMPDSRTDAHGWNEEPSSLRRMDALAETGPGIPIRVIRGSCLPARINSRTTGSAVGRHSHLAANRYLASDAVQTNWFWHCGVGGKAPPASQGNVTTHPEFVSADPAAPDYRLQPDSPCVNTGANQAWMDGATDVDGLQRRDRWQRRVDIGAYEYLGPGTLFGVR